MKTLITLPILALAALVFVWLTWYQVKPYEQTFVVQLGEIKSLKTEPGIYAKVPFLQSLKRVSKKLLDFDANPIEVITADKQRMVVNNFIRYRITDPLKFYTTVGSEYGAEQRLGTFLESSMRQIVGATRFSEIVSEDRRGVMQRILEKVAKDASGIGIEVEDVRITRAELPDQNKAKIYERMQTERQQEASRIRAKGDKEAKTVRAVADRKVTAIKGDAERENRKIRGDADAKVTRIYAEAYGADAEFFAFYRSHEFWRSTYDKPSDSLFVLSPETFYRFFDGIRVGDDGKPERAGIR